MHVPGEKEQIKAQEQTSLNAPSFKPSSNELVIGTVVGFDESGAPIVSFPEGELGESLPALTTVTLAHESLGRRVVLSFISGDLNRPIIIGFLKSPLQSILDGQEVENNEADGSALLSSGDSEVQAAHSEQKYLEVDGQRMTLEGKDKIVLKCGDASITLTKEGKVLIRGKYVLNRSSGVNRILGGSVQLN